jgi:hypothetical protein
MREQEFLGKVIWLDSGLDTHRPEREPGHEGSPFWPEREDLLLEFTRLLGAAQEGGSTVAECVSTANAVDFSDDVSWSREWTRTADVSRTRADAALANGKLLTARSNWLRAMNYYQAAALPFDRGEQSHRSAIASMRRCAASYVRHASPRGEIVQIPWPSGYLLEGYFLPAPGGAGRAAAVLCVAEPGQYKEEYLYKAAHYARDRGMAMLAVDLFGTDTGEDFEEVVGRRDLEATIGCVMDYLVGRDDVDERRIAILSDGMRSSFVARGIAFDDRYAAAVCDGGIWDLHEREFLRDLAQRDSSLMMRPTLSRAARSIQCPVLIPAGERGWLQPERVRQLYDQLKADGRDVTLKIFTNRETAATEGHADNPTLANEFIFDWIESRLGARSVVQGRRGRVPAWRASDA